MTYNNGHFANTVPFHNNGHFANTVPIPTGAWLYCLGPLVGGVLACLLYGRFVSKAETPEPGKDG